MEFLKDLVIPQSAVHIKLLHYMLMLNLCLFIPFISLLFGGTILSLYYRKKGYDKNDLQYLRFSKDLIEIVTVNKSLGFILGIAPSFTALLIFSQLLNVSNTSISGFLAGSFLISSIGVILIYSYRYSLAFNNIFNYMSEHTSEKEEMYQEVQKFRRGSIQVINKTGLTGIFCLFVGMWLFVASVTFATFPDDWVRSNLLNVLFSLKVILRFTSFIISSFAITGGALFFNFFFWEGGRKNIDSNYKNFVRKASLSVSFTSMVLLPLFLLIDIIILPDVAMSLAVFSYSVAAILLVFLALHLLYSMIKYSNTRYSGSIFFVILFVLLASVVKDELAMSNATRLQTVILSQKFEEYMNGLTGLSKEKTVAVRSGEEIYQGVCSACHSFDKVVVGPAYDNVLPQFEGKKDALVAFIRNPVKVNPKFPPMPNPGLSLAEARNIADYEIIHHMQDVFPQRTAEAGNDGEKIFNTICAACHAYDHAVVGPAFNEVLSKYVGHENDLVSFVNDPQKINPNFPQMPKPGLNQDQLKAITTYVLAEYRKKK